MARTEINREGVLKAIAEYDNLGRAAFLRHYGFNGARDYFLVHDGRSYDSKAIAAVAHKWAPDGDGEALSPLELSGGRTDAARRLQELGFEVTSPSPNDDWTWDEHILALDLYMTNPTSPPSKTSAQVAELSRLLRQRGASMGSQVTEKFRNANGIYMKMMNFRRLDPVFLVQGKAGLGRGSKGEEEVWDRYAKDRNALQVAARAIKDGMLADHAAPIDVHLPTSRVPHFAQAFERFKQLVALNQKGAAFTNFSEGVVAAYEAYKPRLRQCALEILAPHTWTDSMVGTGEILERTIDAIEIQDVSRSLTNNLVFWQNRYGHANRDHRALLEARGSRQDRKAIEAVLLGLYQGGGSDEASFEDLNRLSGGKYPLLAYLFYLKDDRRYLPIQPTGFDAAFQELGIDLVTLRNCQWPNYQAYLAAIAAVQDSLSEATGLADIELIDAHSFCWLLVKLPSTEAAVKQGTDPGRIAGAREKAIVNMRLSIETTVRQANGQQVLRTMKNKELLIDGRDLEQLLRERLKVQEDRCALTGIPLEFDGTDSNLLPSADRIDSSGHYSKENIQVVCRFINFWKSSMDNEEFTRLLDLVRRKAN